MTKQELMKQYEEVKDNVDSITLFIHMPTGETETITNPNVKEKMSYIDKTYNDDLIHNNCSNIYIEDVHFTHIEDTYDFGDVIHFLKDGMKMARKGWNGKKQYIELASNISYVNSTNEVVNAEHDAIGNKAIASVGTSGVQLGWLASQADMLASDWVIVE